MGPRSRDTRKKIKKLMSSINSRSITEGKTLLFVPEQLEPVKYPSFFNSRGKYVRDVSIICYRAYAETLKENGAFGGKLSFADPLCGTGARGVRVANELPDLYDRVFLNDISPSSIALAKRSAAENGVERKCFFTQEEACAFLLTRGPGGDRFDAVDVDPFGTPSPYVDCALRATKQGGMLSVSATDTAVLCGVYPKVAQRKYLGSPLRTDYAHEIGLRLIFGLLSMTAMRFEASIMPLFCHHDMHYFRAYCLVQIGNSLSRQNEAQIGYALHCFRCAFRRIASREELASEIDKTCLNCPNCAASAMKVAGPLWAGKIQSQDFVATCAKFSELAIFKPESDLPLYYDLSEISDFMEIRTPKIADVMKELESAGHLTTRTRLNRNALRTAAPLPELQAVLARLSR